MILYSLDNFITVIRFFVGLILVLIGLKAFLRTRIPSMFYLTLGFALITIGDMFSAIYYFDNMRMNNLVSDIFDLLGLIALIIAVTKS